MIPKKPALGPDHRKSDVSDLRQFMKSKNSGTPRVRVVNTGFRKRSCSSIMLERDDDSMSRHPTPKNRGDRWVPPETTNPPPVQGSLTSAPPPSDSPAISPS